MSAPPFSVAETLREPTIGPVVTVRGAANLGISFMAVSSRIKPDGRNGRTNGGVRPLRPFAGMTRIRFKGFGLSPSQPRSGRPSSKANVVRVARSVNFLSKHDFYAAWRRGAIPQGP